MSVTAKQLSKSGARGKDLDAIVREQLQIVDDKLLRADLDKMAKVIKAAGAGLAVN